MTLHRSIKPYIDPITAMATTSSHPPALIPLSIIQDNPWQTRSTYDDEHIDQLAASIAANGLLSPPRGRVVDAKGVPMMLTDTFYKPHGFEDLLGEVPGVRVQLAFGHNRLRAFQKIAEGFRLDEGAEAGEDLFARLPVVLGPLTDEQMATLAYSENYDRSDISPIDDALAMQKRLSDFGWTQKKLAEKLGLKRPTVSNRLRLLKLPEHVQTEVRLGTLTERKAVALLPLYALREQHPEVVDSLLVDQWHSSRGIDYFLHEAKNGLSSSGLRIHADRLKGRVKHEIERQESLQESQAKLAAEGKDGLVHTRDLDWSAYTVVTDTSLPKGCSSDCPCYKQAMHYNREVGICTDPKRHKKLKTKAKREKNKVQRAIMDTQIDAFYAVLGDEATSSAWLTLMLEAAVSKVRSKAVQAAISRLSVSMGWDDATLIILQKLTNWGDHCRAVAYLLPAEQVLQLMTAMLVENILMEKREYGLAAPSEEDWNAMLGTWPEYELGQRALSKAAERIELNYGNHLGKAQSTADLWHAMGLKAHADSDANTAVATHPDNPLPELEAVSDCVMSC